MKKIFLICIIALFMINCGRNGEYTKHYENGNLQWKKTYKDDKLEGKYTSYYENGKIEEEINFEDGEMVGEEKRYSESGQLSDERTHKWITDTQGITKRGRMSVLDGKWTSYYENGQVEFERNYKDGDPADGLSGIYYDDAGNITDEYYYKNGERIKEISYWESEDDIKMTTTKSPGKKDIQTKFYDSGVKAFEGELNEDETFDGKVFVWWENGNIQSESIYKNGKPINQKQYSENENEKLIGHIIIDSGSDDCSVSLEDFQWMVSQRLDRMSVQYLNGSGAKSLGNCRYNITGNVLDKIYGNTTSLNWTYRYENGEWIEE